MNKPEPFDSKEAQIIYDGECPLCCALVGSWNSSHQKVEFVASQERKNDELEAGCEAIPDEVILIESSGQSYSGAAAIIRLIMIERWGAGPLLWWLYGRVAMFRWLTEGGYRFVARNRKLISKMKL